MLAIGSISVVCFVCGNILNNFVSQAVPHYRDCRLDFHTTNPARLNLVLFSSVWRHVSALASSNLFLPFTVVGTDWSDVTSQNVWYRICEVIWQRMAGHVTHHPMLKPSSCFPFDSSPKFLYKFHAFQHRVDKPFTSSIDKSWDHFPLPYAAAAVVSSNNLHARICIESVCTPQRPFQQSESIPLQWFQCLLILWQMQKFRSV